MSDYDPVGNVHPQQTPILSGQQVHPGSLYAEYMSRQPMIVDRSDVGVPEDQFGSYDGSVPGFVKSSDPYVVDPDPFGTKTESWGRRNGVPVGTDDVLGLTVFNRPFSRENLLKYDAGRRLLEIEEKKRRGTKRGFLDAITDFQWSDLPFVGLFASVGGSISDAVTVSDTMKKLQNGEEVSDEDLIKTRLYMSEQEYKSNGSWGATVGDIIRAAPGFMAEFFASGTMLSWARAGAIKIAGGSTKALTTLAVSRGNKILARELAEKGLENEVVKKFGSQTTASLMREKVRDLGSDAVRELTDDLTRSMTLKLSEQFGKTLGTKDIGGDVIANIARNLAEKSVGMAKSKLGASSAFTQFSKGLYHSAKEWASAGLLDFGSFGTESSTVLFGGHNKAGTALKDALGILCVEAPLKGSMQYGMNYLLSRPIASAFGNDGRTVSESQLSLQEAALMTDNRQLMESAESISSGINLLEYVSENSGRGFSSLFRSVGLAAGVSKQAERAIEGEIGGLLVEAKKAEAGGFLRNLIRKSVGTTEDYSKATADTRVKSVRNFINREAGRLAKDAADGKIPASGVFSEIGEVEAARIASGNLDGVTNSALREFIGGDSGAFLKRAITDETSRKANDLAHKSYFRYCLADFMVRHQLGPDEAMDAFQRMGYDGIVEEMMEERYSDFAKGLFGLDEYNNNGFGKRLKQAFENLFPGWDQLTAEAVGFAVPMMTRAATMRIQHYLGGSSELQRIRATAANFQAAVRGTRVVEARLGDYLDRVDANIGELEAERERLQRERDEQLKTAADSNITDPEELRRITSEHDASLESVRKRIDAQTESRDRILKVNSITDLASANRDAIMFFSVTDSDTESGDLKGDKLRTDETSDQLARAYGAKQAFISDAWMIGKAMFDSKGPESDQTMPWYKRLAGKIAGLAAAVTTGDMALAMRNYADWAAVDEGLDPNMAATLEEIYRKCRNDAKKAIIGERTENGVVGGYSVTEDEIWDRMGDRYKDAASKAAESFLAVSGVKMFSQTEMLDQAILYSGDRDGWTFDKGTRMFSKPGTDKTMSFSEYYEGNKGKVDRVRDDIAAATLRLLSNGSVSNVMPFVRLPPDSPVRERVAMSLALQMSGFGELIKVRELRKGSDMSEVLSADGLTVSSHSVGRIASASVSADGSVNYAAPSEQDVLNLASQLRIPVETGSDEELANVRRQVVDIARQLDGSVDSANVKSFVHQNDTSSRFVDGAYSYVTAYRRSDGRWYITSNLRPDSDGDVKTVSTGFANLRELSAFMKSQKYKETRREVTVTDTGMVVTDDGFLLLKQLGMGSTYFSRTVKKGRDGALNSLDYSCVHPLLRKDASGSFLYTAEEAERVEREERMLADMFGRHRNDASMYPGETPEKKAVLMNRAKAAYDSVYGEGGYVTVMDGMLEDAGVVVPKSASLLSSMTGMRAKYQMQTRAFTSAAQPSRTFIPIDYANAQDYSGAILSHVFNEAFVRYRSIIRKGAAYNSVLVNFIRTVKSEATKALYSASTTKEQKDELRAVLSDVLAHDANPTPRVFSELATAFAMFMTERDRDTGNSSCAHSLAYQTIAASVRNTPQFLRFYGMVDIMLGGDGFSFVTAASKFGADRTGLPVRGVEKYMNLFHSGTGKSLEKAVSEMKPCGYSFEEFASEVNRMAHGDVKILPQSVKAPEKAAGLMSTLRGIFIGAKFDTPESLNSVFNSLGKVARGDTELEMSVRDAGRSLRSILNGQEDEIARLKAERDGLLEELKKADETKSDVVERNRNALSAVTAKLETALKQNAELKNRILDLERQTSSVMNGGETKPTVDPVRTGIDVAASEAASDANKQPDTPKGVPSRVRGKNAGKTTRKRLTVSTKGVDDNIVTHIDYDENGKPVVVEDPIVAEDLDTVAREFGATVIRTVSTATGTPVGQALTETDFGDIVRKLFPGMPLIEVEELYNVYAAQVENARIRETVDEDDEDEGRQSDADRGYGDKALAEYNDETLKQFLKLASYSSPGTERGLQAFMAAIRTNVSDLLSEMPKKAIGAPRSRRAAILEKIDQILNPRSLGYAQTKENVALEQKIRELDSGIRKASKSGEPPADLVRQRDELKLKLYSSTTAVDREAVWRKAVNELDAGIGGESFGSVIAELLSDDGTGHALDRQTAFLLAFLKGLDRPARVRLMTLCANSAVCSRTKIHPFSIYDKEDKLTESGLEITPETGRFASVGERVLTSSFMPMVRMKSSEIRTLADRIRENYAKAFAAGEFNMVPSGSTGNRKSFRTDRLIMEKNFKAIAHVLSPVLGRECPLVQALRSQFLFDYYKESHRFDRFSRADDNASAIASATQDRYLETDRSGRLSETKHKDGLPPMIRTIVNVLTALSSERDFSDASFSDSRNAVMAREEALSRVCVTEFACGLVDREGAAVGHKMAENSTVWALLLSDYTASQPDTIAPADLIPERSMKSSASVAVSSRGIVPVISRWMDRPITDKTSFAYIAKNFMPGSYGAKYRTMSDAEFMEKVVSECRQTMTWPDPAHTPILAKNLSRDYNADEVYNACERQFNERFRDGKTVAKNNVGTRWFVPVFSGDHSSGVLLQMPEVKSGEGGDRTCLGKPFGDASTYGEFADYMNRAIGLGRLGRDPKRSALSCLEAPAVAMRGCRTDRDGTLKFGETRIHVLFNYASDFTGSSGDAGKQEALKGTMIGTGYGLEEQRKIAKDPRSRIAKLHYLSASGVDLTMLKSLTSVVGENSSETEGAYVEGSVERVLADYLVKFRSSDSDISTSIMMDLDGYKVGPGMSQLMGVLAGETGKDGKPKTVPLLRYVFDRLRNADVGTSFSLADLDRMLGDGEEAPELPDTATPEERKRNEELYRPGTFAWMGADGKETRVTVSDILGVKDSEGNTAGGDAGIQVHVVDGLSGPALDFSYVDNSLMSYAVANVSHESAPENGRSPRNYMIDAITMAGSMLRAGMVTGESRQSVEGLLELVANWGLATSAVETDDSSIEDLRNESRSTNLKTLVSKGEDIHGLNADNQLAFDLFKRLRKALNMPMNKIDSALISCGAVYDDGLGRVVDHTKDPFLRLMHLGSRVYSVAEARWRGTSRSLGMGQINVSSDGFRYGWHLDRKAFAKEYGAEYETMSARELGEVLESLFTEVHEADLRSAEAFRTGAADGYVGYMEARKAARGLRDRLTRCFTDHFGQRISGMKCAYEQHDAFSADPENNHDEYRWSVSFDDLFIAGNGSSRVFDRSALCFGNRDYRLGADHAEGIGHMAEDEDPLFLAGTTFGLPRTPSYNGSMWLQTLRAFMPATVRTDPDGRTFRAGYDAAVIPDPQSLSILGCDHDGDKAQCYLSFVDTETGVATCASIPRPKSEEDGVLVDADLSGFARDQVLKRKYVQQLCSAGLVLERESGKDADGNSCTRYRMDDWSRNWISNQFVRGLFDMSRALPVDAGDEEKDFYGTRFAKATKARPVGKEAWDRLVKFADSDANFLKDSTIANTLTGAHVSTSSQSSDRARGMIVSLASVLHIAQFSGKFRNSLFRGWTGDGMEMVQSWVDFMYRVDGISNATFDDIKEQICRRLGWTAGMMDTVLVDLITSGERAPRTDDEFVDALIRYTESVSGKRSRYYMMVSSDPADGNEAIADLHRRMRKFFRSEDAKAKQKNAVPDKIYRQSVVEFFGLEATYGKNGETVYVPKQGAVVDARVKKVLASMNAARIRRNEDGKASAAAIGETFSELTEPAMYRALVSAVSKHAGVCPGSGYAYYMFTKVAKGKEGSLGDEADAFVTWIVGHQTMSDARQFASAVNYTKADPGDPSRIAGRKTAVDSFGRTMLRGASKAGSVQAFVDSVLTRMTEAASTAYGAASIATLRGRGGLSVENRGVAIAWLAERLQHSGVHTVEARKLVTALMAADPIRSFDISKLEANQQMVPYFISVLRTMDRAISGTETMDGRENQWKTMRTIADAMSGSADNTFALRKGIESMFSVMYALMSTSEAMRRCPAAAFFALRQDRAWSGQSVKYEKDATQAYRGSARTRRLVAFLRNKDAGSRARARQYVRMVTDGFFDGLKRVDKYNGAVGADSFSLSVENLTEFKKERMLPGLSEDVDNVIAILKKLGEGTVITPSTMFRQFVPLYTTFTERVTSNESVLDLMPDTYARISAEQAKLYSGVLEGQDSPVPPGTGVCDAVCATNNSPVNRELIRKLRRKAKNNKLSDEAFTFDLGNVDTQLSEEIIGYLAGLPDTDPPSSDFSNDEHLRVLKKRLRSVDGDPRSNTSSRYMLDVLSRNGILDTFHTFTDEKLGPSVREEPESDPVETEIPEDVGVSEGDKPDKRVERLVMLTRNLVSSWADVEYVKGGKSFVIRSRNGLNGSASRRFGGGARTSAAITVNIGTDRFAGKEIDVNSPEVMSSFCAVTRKSLNLQVSDLMRLTEAERRALFDRYLNGGVSVRGAGANFSLALPSWSVSADGMKTLAGEINIGEPNSGNLYHEYFHSMIGMFRTMDVFSDADVREFRKRFGGPREGVDELFDEETAAEEFRKYVSGLNRGDTTYGTVPSENDDRCVGIFRRLLNAIKAFLNAMLESFSHSDPGAGTVIFDMVINGYAAESREKASELADSSIARDQFFRTLENEEKFAETEATGGESAEESAGHRVDDILGTPMTTDPMRGYEITNEVELGLHDALMSELDPEGLLSGNGHVARTSAVASLIRRIVDFRTNGTADNPGPVVTVVENDPSVFNASQALRWRTDAVLNCDPVTNDAAGEAYTPIYSLGRALVRETFGNATDEDVALIRGASSRLPFTQKLMSEARMNSRRKTALERIEQTAKAGVSQFLRLNGVGKKRGAKDAQLRNDLYMGLMSAYGNRHWGIRNVAVRSSMSKTRSYIVEFSGATGTVGAKNNVSASDYVGFLIAAGQQDVRTFVESLRSSLEKRRDRALRGGDESNRVSAVATRLLGHLEEFESIDTTSLLSDPDRWSSLMDFFCRDVFTGITRGEFDKTSGTYGPYRPDNKDSELARDNRAAYQLGKDSAEDSAVQAMLTECADTMYGIQASVKFFRELGMQPGSFTNAEFTSDNVPPMEFAELATEFGLGSNQLIGDEDVIERCCQPSFVLAHVDDWYASTLPRMFGNSSIRDTFMNASREVRGVVSSLVNVENFMAAFMGLSRLEGRKLLGIVRRTGKFEMGDGFWSRVEPGKEQEYVGFDIVHGTTGKVTDVEFTEDEYRMTDMFMKMLSVLANGGRRYVTGVDDIRFTYGTFAPKRDEYYDPKKVAEMVTAKRTGNHSAAVPPALMAMYRLGLQIPEEIAGKPNDKDGLYRRFVDGICDAVSYANLKRMSLLNEKGEEMTDAQYNDLVLRELESRGLVITSEAAGSEKGMNGEPLRGTGTLVIDATTFEKDVFRRSSAYDKLVRAGRDIKVFRNGKGEWVTATAGNESEWKDLGDGVMSMLDSRYIIAQYMGEWNKLRSIVKGHPWLTKGDGALFNNFDTPFPFFSGSGMFMYHANRAARNTKAEDIVRLGKHEDTFMRMCSNTKLNGIGLDGITPGMAAMLHDYFGTKEEGLDLIGAIVNGEYASGTDKAMDTGLELDPSGTLVDVAKVVYLKQLERRLKAIEGRRPIDFDDDGAIERMISAWETARGGQDTTLAGAAGMTDEQMFRLHGVLPANMQIGHKVHLAVKNVTDALYSRSVLVNMLFTKGREGNPVFYMNPAKFAVEAGGIPDSVWAAVAKWWASRNPGLKYDSGLSGVENAREMYSTISAAAKTNGWKIHGRTFQTLTGDEISDSKSIEGVLCQADDPGDDNVSGLNRIGGKHLYTFDGGEAIGYARHFFQTGRVPGGAKLQWMDHVLAWTKSLNVACSFFFPIATKWESPVAAVGALATLGSNWSPEFVRKHSDALNALQKAFTLGTKDGWLGEEFIGFRDIMEMMDSNDPFLSDIVMWAESLGITMSTQLRNPMEPGRGYLERDLRSFVDRVREVTGSAKLAGRVDGVLDVLLRRGSEKAFTYALNATKLAVTCQVVMKMRAAAKRAGRAFDIIRDASKLAAYNDSEIGGVDTLRYAWAHPMMQAILNRSFFSWQWTRTAWEAGGGPIFEDALFGGHTMNKETRRYIVGRWLRMFGTVMIGVPMMAQMLIKALAVSAGRDDDDDKWFTWQNEDKACWTAYDITPLMKIMAEYEPVARLASGALGGLYGMMNMGPLGALAGAVAGATAAPVYTGTDEANSTTGNRRYYQHFGKQGWEFFRWFDRPDLQLASKQNMWLQRFEEGMLGRSLSYMDRELPWNDTSLAERWLYPTRDSALVNMAKSVMPFTVSGLSSFGDAGVLSMFGPVQMGASQTAVIERMKDRLAKWGSNDRRGYRFGKAMTKTRRNEVFHGILGDLIDEAHRNGIVDVEPLITRALGQITPKVYGKLFDEATREDTSDIDVPKMRRMERSLARLGSNYRKTVASFDKRLKVRGISLKRMNAENRVAMLGSIRAGYRNPFSDEPAAEPARYDY